MCNRQKERWEFTIVETCVYKVTESGSSAFEAEQEAIALLKSGRLRPSKISKPQITKVKKIS